MVSVLPPCPPLPGVHGPFGSSGIQEPCLISGSRGRRQGRIQQIAMLLRAQAQNLTPIPEGQLPARGLFAKRFGILHWFQTSQVSMAGRALSFCIRSDVYPRALPSPSLAHRPDAAEEAAQARSHAGPPQGSRVHRMHPGGGREAPAGAQTGMDVGLGHLAAKGRKLA